MTEAELLQTTVSLLPMKRKALGSPHFSGQSKRGLSSDTARRLLRVGWGEKL